MPITNSVNASRLTILLALAAQVKPATKISATAPALQGDKLVLGGAGPREEVAATYLKIARANAEQGSWTEAFGGLTKAMNASRAFAMIRLVLDASVKIGDLSGCPMGEFRRTMTQLRTTAAERAASVAQALELVANDGVNPSFALDRALTLSKTTAEAVLIFRAASQSFATSAVPFVEKSRDRAIELAGEAAKVERTMTAALAHVRIDLGATEPTYSSPAYQAAVALSTTIAETFTVADYAVATNQRTVKRWALDALQRGIDLSTTAADALHVADKALQLKFPDMAEKAADRALELAGGSADALDEVIKFTLAKGQLRVAERAADRVSNP